MNNDTIFALLDVMFDESPLALDEYFKCLSEDDQTFAAGFINGFMMATLLEDDNKEGNALK